MSRRRPISAAAMIAALALSGCGSGLSAGPAVPRQSRSPAVSLATAVAGPGASWAVVRLSGPGGQRRRFWQLLVAATGGPWRLVTPPGVADNGGLAITATAGGGLTAAFVPSALLTFTPLAVTRDGGGAWTPGLLPASIAAEPGAIASLPGGRLLAITPRSAELSNPAGTGWSTLVTLRSLAASQAGRRCGLLTLTAAAADPSGAPLLAGDCDRPGQVGIFGRTGGSGGSSPRARTAEASGWQAAGPALPASLAGQPIAVLRLAGDGTAALLLVGAGRHQLLIPAWRSGPGPTWTLGAPVRLGGQRVESVSAGTAGQWGVVLTGRHGLIIGGAPGHPSPPRTLPTLPASAAAVLPGPRQVTVIAPGDSSVSVWQLTGNSAWQRSQLIAIPVISS